MTEERIEGSATAHQITKARWAGSYPSKSLRVFGNSKFRHWINELTLKKPEIPEREFGYSGSSQRMPPDWLVP